MPPIKIDINTATDLSVLTMEGVIDLKEIIHTLDHFYSNNTTSRLLWDLNQADMQNVSAEDLKEILSIGDRRGHLRKRSKTALLASQPLGFAMARQISTLAEGYSNTFVIKAFRNQQDAMQWLLMSN